MNRGTMLAGALAVMGLLGVAGGAMGSVTITSVDRAVSVDAYLAALDVGPFTDFDIVQTDAKGIFEASLLAEAEFLGTFGRVAASQTSNIQGNSISGQLLTTAAVATNESNPFALTEIDVSAFSRMEIEFVVYSEVSMVYSGSFVSWWGIEARAFLLLSGPDGFVDLVNDGSDEIGSVFEQEFILVPGVYTLVAESYIDEVNFPANNPFETVPYTLDFQLMFIPVPGSLALLAFGGLVASRRRR